MCAYVCNRVYACTSSKQLGQMVARIKRHFSSSGLNFLIGYRIRYWLPADVADPSTNVRCLALRHLTGGNGERQLWVESRLCDLIVI